MFQLRLVSFRGILNLLNFAGKDIEIRQKDENDFNLNEEVVNAIFVHYFCSFGFD